MARARLALVSLLTAAAALAAPHGASAVDPVVVADPAAEQITALDGTIAWVTGPFGHQRLMLRRPDGTIAPVAGAPESRSYRAIDLGRDADGKLLLTYERCESASRCKMLWNDLDGRRATYRGITPPQCRLTAVSQWRTRIAYGLDCFGSTANRKLTGLYRRTRGHAPVRLPRPKDAVRFGVRHIESVDLRGLRVAAVAADIYEYSFSQTLGGRDMRSIFPAASEGDSDESARGLAIQSASTHWTLVTSSHVGDPNAAVIFQVVGDCVRRERLVSAPDAESFLASDVAVDGAALYLLVPGTGIVAHTFAPEPTPSCS